MLETFYQMDVLGYIYDAQGLFSLFGRRLLELGSPGDKNVRYVAVDRDGVLVGFLGGPDNHLVRCAVDGYTCTGATGLELAWLRNSRLRAELARGVGHNLATWTTHEMAQRQEVSSCTQGFNGPKGPEASQTQAFTLLVLV